MWDSGQVSAAQAGVWCGCPSGGRRAKFGSAQGCSSNAGQAPAGRSPAVGGQHSLLCSFPGVEGMRKGEEFLPGAQVSSPGSWKSISTSALQGTRSDRHHLPQRQG